MADVYGTTVLHPVGLGATIVFGLAMIVLPRRWSVVPLLAMATFIPSAQRVVVADIDLNLLRIIALMGWVRVLLRSEWLGFRWKLLDVMMVAFAVSGTIAYTLLWGTTGALVNRLGYMFDAVGIYFLLRCLVRGYEDIDALAIAASALSIPIMLAFILEYVSSRNVFAVFGGVNPITRSRDGRLRCMGPYSHPILAGCYWSVLMPLMAARWWSGGWGRYTAAIGVGCAMIIVFTCASSTPVVAVMMGAVGGGAFLVRHYLRYIRWSIAGGLFLLHLVMNRPVWYILGFASIVGGSTGLHRAHLIDAAVKHLGDWWLVGVKDTMYWGPASMNLGDVTNQYIREGVCGGLLTMLIFIAIVVVAFAGVGRLLRQRMDVRTLAVVWAMGSALFMHAMIFIAVSYFGQIKLLWCLQLALIGSMLVALDGARASAPSRERSRRASVPLGGPLARSAGLVEGR